MARVPIELKVSKADAARIDEVLTRPEFTGWTRADWCREMIRTALRYYVGGGPAPGPGQDSASGRPAAAQPAPSSQPRAPAAVGAATEERAAGAAGPVLPDGSEPSPSSQDAPEPPSQADCSHPAEARDYETGTCAACGAILWD